MTLCRWILLRIRNVSDKVCRENPKHTFHTQYFFPENRPIYETMCKKCGGNRQTTDHNIIRRRRFYFWILTATDTHWKYLIPIAFPRQQWLREHRSITLYLHRPYCIISWEDVFKLCKTECNISDLTWICFRIHLQIICNNRNCILDCCKIWVVRLYTLTLCPNHTETVFEGKDEALRIILRPVPTSSPTKDFIPLCASLSVHQYCVFLTYFAVSTRHKDMRP
jgi:hypothetical protein